MYRQGLVVVARLRGGIRLVALRGDQKKKKKKKEMMRQISRRRKYSSSSSSAATSMQTKEDSLKGKYLNLCFCEHVIPAHLCTCDVVHSIKLSNLLSSTTKDDEDDVGTKIEQEAYKSTEMHGSPLPWAYDHLGSQILFTRSNTSNQLHYKLKVVEPIRGEILVFDACLGLTFTTPIFTLPCKDHR
ncbi:hypothetical protein M0R45_020109 [Rubus argutus]|uniref:Uncharacterized protein n=1 Tax=Rubus argutus TaxID=59490 RepID=A0AAW1X7C7_RUBAR